MTRLAGKLLRLSLATAAGAACLLASDTLSLRNPGSFVTQAHAIIGRPLTPMSYAGVARRTTRRAAYGAGVYGAGVYGAAAVGAAAVASPCVRVATAYGLVTRCY